MAIPMEAEKRPGETTQEELLRKVSSRKAGGGLITTKPPTVRALPLQSLPFFNTKLNRLLPVTRAPVDNCRPTRVQSLPPIPPPRRRVQSASHDFDRRRLRAFGVDLRGEEEHSGFGAELQFGKIVSLLWVCCLSGGWHDLRLLTLTRREGTGTSNARLCRRIIRFRSCWSSLARVSHSTST